MSPNWFIGFPVHPKTWYEEVITDVPAGIKCFNPADLHMTFAFLGAVDEAVAIKAWNVAANLGLSAFSITFGPMEPFGNPIQPSAYAFTLKMGKEKAITYMRQHQTHLLELAGTGPEKYAPRPHITIARPPRQAPEELRSQGLLWVENVRPPLCELLLNQLALYTWSDDRSIQQFKIAASTELF